MRQKAGAQGGQKADSRRARPARITSNEIANIVGHGSRYFSRSRIWSSPALAHAVGLCGRRAADADRPDHLVADAAGTKDHPLRRLKCERAGRLARRELRKSACEFSVVIELEHRSKTDRGVGFAPGCLEGVNPGGIAAQHCDALCVRVDHRRGNAKALSAAERDGGAHRCACWRIPTA